MQEQLPTEPEEINIFSIKAAFTTAGALKISTTAIHGTAVNSLPGIANSKDDLDRAELQRDLEYAAELAWLEAPASAEDIAGVNNDLHRAQDAAWKAYLAAKAERDAMCEKAAHQGGEAVFMTRDESKVISETGRVLTDAQRAEVPEEDLKKGDRYEDFLPNDNAKHQTFKDWQELAATEDVKPGASNADVKSLRDKLAAKKADNPDSAKQLSTDEATAGQGTPASPVANGSGFATTKLTESFQPAHDGPGAAPDDKPAIAPAGPAADPFKPG